MILCHHRLLTPSPLPTFLVSTQPFLAVKWQLWDLGKLYAAGPITKAILSYVNGICWQGFLVLTLFQKRVLVNFRQTGFVFQTPGNVFRLISISLQTVCTPPRTVQGVHNIATNSVHLSVCPFLTRQDCVQTV